MKLKIGDLVRWIAEYDDNIVRDSGIGVVLGSEQYSYQDIKHTSYMVYRNGVGDKIPISDRNVFKLQIKEK